VRSLRSPAVVEAAVAATVVALAAALRVVGSGSGLPLPLLNPDETNIVPRAWELVHGGGLDPGWYDYPSLLFLLVAPSQIGLDAPSYGTARVVAILIGLLGVAAAWWTWTRFGLRDAVRRRAFVHTGRLAIVGDEA